MQDQFDPSADYGLDPSMDLWATLIFWPSTSRHVSANREFSLPYGASGGQFVFIVDMPDSRTGLDGQLQFFVMRAK